MLVVMQNFTDEENLSQPLQTKDNQFKIAIIILTAYNGIINISSNNKKFHFTVSINGVEFSLIYNPPRTYELECLNDEVERINIEEGFSTDPNCPILIETIFLTLGSFIENSSTSQQLKLVSFMMIVYQIF